MKTLTEAEQRDYATMLASETVADLRARLRSLEATWGPLSSRACVVRGLIDGLSKPSWIGDPGRYLTYRDARHFKPTAYETGFRVGLASRKPWRPGDGLDTGACPGCEEAKH